MDSIAAESSAYRSLHETMNNISETYTSLNPVDGLIGGPGGLQGHDAILREFVRGGIVRAWAVWEAFVDELVEDAFELAIIISSSRTNINPYAPSTDQEQLGLLMDNWPISHTILRTQIGQRMKAKTTTDQFEDHHDQDTESKESGKKKPPEMIALNLLLEKHCWQHLLWEYMTSEVNKMPHGVFLGDTGIDNTFSALFHKKMRVSQDVVEYVCRTRRDGVEFIGMSYYYQLPARGPTQCANILIKEAEGLHNMLRLYYGLRCAFSHGSTKKTLEHGALKNFPVEPEGIKIVGTDRVGGPENQNVAKSLSDLYREVCTNGKNAIVYYADLLNMIRFLRLCARMLLYVIARWIYNTFNVTVWRYNPFKDRNCKSGSETRNKECGSEIRNKGSTKKSTKKSTKE